MSKQEEIKEGIAKILRKSMSVRIADTIHGKEKEYFFPCGVDELIEYLHSQGVVLKVERELPKRTRYYQDTDKDYACEGGFANATARMKEAGYEATAPLIGERVVK